MVVLKRIGVLLKRVALLFAVTVLERPLRATPCRASHMMPLLVQRNDGETVDTAASGGMSSWPSGWPQRRRAITRHGRSLPRPTLRPRPRPMQHQLLWSSTSFQLLPLTAHSSSTLTRLWMCQSIQVVQVPQSHFFEKIVETPEILSGQGSQTSQ